MDEYKVSCYSFASVFFLLHTACFCSHVLFESIFGEIAMPYPRRSRCIRTCSFDIFKMLLLPPVFLTQFLFHFYWFLFSICALHPRLPLEVSLLHFKPHITLSFLLSASTGTRLFLKHPRCTITDRWRENF
jgi:hypothetical protein